MNLNIQEGKISEDRPFLPLYERRINLFFRKFKYFFIDLKVR